MSAPTAEGGRVTRDTARREVATARCRLTPGIGVEDVARLDVAPSVRERLLEHPSRAWRIESGEGGTFYGVVGVYPLAGVGEELVAYLVPSATGSGIGSEICRSVLAYWRTVLGIERIVARTQGDARAARCLRALHFVECRTLGGTTGWARDHMTPTKEAVTAAAQR